MTNCEGTGHLYAFSIAAYTLTEYSAPWVDFHTDRSALSVCGFIGGTNPDWAYSRALEAIAHRGPDDSRLIQTGDVSLGFRRLAIIDLDDNANQPMASIERDTWLVFNGEIYGYQKIRAELAANGTQFRTHSDSEVVLNAYLRWGDDFINRIDGMFAIAIWDGPKHTLKIFRDRPGIKPLYYFYDGKNFAFASELKAFEAAFPTNTLQKDETALYDFLGYRYVPAPKTLYRNCFKLEPGHSIEYRTDTNKLSQPTPYWRLPVPDEPQSPSIESACEQLRALINTSVSEQLVADVPVGFFLSGGVDSSVVVASAALQGVNVETFSIGFDSDDVSETPYARQVAKLFKTNHHERILTKDSAQALLPKLKQWFDEPFADESAMPTFLVSSAARENVTVVLTGDGGDEVFGGYRTYQRYARYAGWPNWPSAFERLSSRTRSKLHRRSTAAHLLKLLEMGFSSGLSLWARIMGGMPHAAKSKYREMFGIPEDYDDWWHYAKHWRNDLPLATRLQYLDFHTFMPGLVLTKVDRTSMAVSLEARVPLLDRRIVEFSFSLPEQIRLFQNKPKGLLREAYKSILPAEILDRRKKGFGIPRYYLHDIGDGKPVQEHILQSLFL